MTDTNTRMSELRKRSRELSEATQQLPGRAAADDRKLVADAFGKAAASLELLGGPNPGGAYRQQLRIIENTRNFLGSGAAGVAPDPSVDTGLRSMENALAGVRERLFPNDEKIRSQLDTLRTRLADLDTVRGPIHSLVVARAFGSAANVIDTMSGELDARNEAVQQAQQPAPAPATQPTNTTAAIPAAASTPPAPSQPMTPRTPPAPAAPPAPPAAPKPPTPPTPPAAPSPAAQQQQYEQLQKDYQRLQQQYQELQQKYQQQQQQQQQSQQPAR